MKRKPASKSAFFNPRVVVGLVFCSIVLVAALLGFALYPGGNAFAETKPQQDTNTAPAFGSLVDTASSVENEPVIATQESDRPIEGQIDTTCVTALSENFDSVVAPALPAGWSATNTVVGDGILWVTSTTTPDTAPNDAFVNDPSLVSDKNLDTPSIAIGSGPAVLNFRNNYNLEPNFDGGVLEVSINGGAFTDIITAGGSFISAGYNGTISTAFSSPISGRMAWTGNAGAYLSTSVNLGASVIGQSIKLRFRMASDSSVAATGWRIDTITLTLACPTPSPSPTPTPDASGCVWAAGPVVPVPLLDTPVVTVGANMYAFGGVQSGAITANSYKFDGTTWTPIAPLPTAVEFPAAVTDGVNCYILGGALTGTGTPQTTVYRYNVGANNYTTLAPFTTGTWNHCAVYLAGKIYKFAGTGPSTASTNVLEIYDVGGNSWSAGAVYPLSISFVSSFTQGGFIYGAGGIASVGSVASAKTYRYDPIGNTWDDASINDMPATRWGAASASYGGKWVNAGGYVAGSATANISPTTIRWDPGTNIWENLPNMLGERSRMTGDILNGCMYVVGGRSIASPAFAGTTDNQKLCCVLGTPTPSPTPCPLCTPTPSPTASPSPSPSPSPTPSPTNTPTCATFSNTGVITIPAGAPGTTSGPASPYPSNISVSGVGGTVTYVRVNLLSLSHTFPADIDILLVGPGGQNAIIMSDVGGSAAVTNVNLTLEDGAAIPIPAASLPSGTYQPTNSGAGDPFVAPAPAPLGGSALSIFNGTNANGTWSLYVVDDAGGDVGAFNGGWSLEFATNTVCTGPTPTPNPTASPTPTVSPTPTPAPTCPGGTKIFTELFDSVVPPALPAGWVATNMVNPDGVFWVTSNSGVPTPVADTLPNAAFVNDPSVVSDKYLDSPAIAIASALATVTFRNNFALEASPPTNYYDGGVLEISIGGGGFTDILNAGGSFTTGGYTGTISTAFSSPLAARPAWSGSSAGFITTTANLPAAAAGQSIKLRWRMASDSSVSNSGWRIDGVSITDCLAATVTISGTVGNCASPVPTATPPATPTPPTLPPVPNVLMTLTGSSSGTTNTDAGGNYSFTVNTGGSYTVTPSKGPLTPGAAGINTVDVLAIQRHFLLITIIPAGCRLTAADAVINGTINTQDVLAVQRFFLALTSGTGSTGQYKFTPANRAYAAIGSNQTGQNYTMYVVGDVAAPFNNRPGEVQPDAPSTVGSVMLPDVSVDQSRSELTPAVKTSAIDGRDNIVGFQGDFTFDERVVNFANEPVAAAGLTANNWNVAGNVLPGNGPIRTLRISAYSTDFMPLNGIGTLFNLRIAQVNKGAGSSPLMWAAPPDNFIFINADLQSQHPGNTFPGSVSPGRR